MGISVVTAAAEEPVTLDLLKAHLRQPHDEEDGYLAGLILTARQWCENETRRVFVTQTLDYTLDSNWPVRCVEGFLRTRIELPLGSVSSVTSVSYVDESGATQTLAGGNYFARLNEDIPYIEPAYNVSWPAVRNQSSAITVRFVAGWSVSAVPEPLRTAICCHVEILLDRDPAQRELLERARDNLLDHYRIRRIF